MNDLGNIKDCLQQIAQVNKELFFVAQLTAIKDDTCTIKINDLSIDGVRLRAITDSNSANFLISPKINSYVLVADLSNGLKRNLVVICYSEIEQLSIKFNDNIKITINNDGVAIDSNQITLNGGNNKGIVSIQPLLDSLNSIKNYITALQSATSTAIGGTYSLGPGLQKTFDATMETKSIVISNMEDTKITH